MGEEGEEKEQEEGNEKEKEEREKGREEKGKRRYITVGKHDGRLARAAKC